MTPSFSTSNIGSRQSPHGHPTIRPVHDGFSNSRSVASKHESEDCFVTLGLIERAAEDHVDLREGLSGGGPKGWTLGLGLRPVGHELAAVQILDGCVVVVEVTSMATDACWTFEASRAPALVIPPAALEAAPAAVRSASGSERTWTAPWTQPAYCYHISAWVPSGPAAQATLRPG